MLYLQASMSSQILQVSCIKHFSKEYRKSQEDPSSHNLSLFGGKMEKKEAREQEKSERDIRRCLEGQIKHQSVKKIIDCCDAIGGEERQRQVFQRKQKKQRELLFSVLISFRSP